MLRLIMGRARSGKSRRIRELLAERVHAGGKVLLIVPEQYSFESEKNLLDLLGPENQSNVEILYTFTSLSNFRNVIYSMINITDTAICYICC